MDMGEVERMFRLNATALTELTQRFAKAMVARRRGYILDVSSASAFLPTPSLRRPTRRPRAYVLAFSEALR